MRMGRSHTSPSPLIFRPLKVGVQQSPNEHTLGVNRRTGTEEFELPLYLSPRLSFDRLRMKSRKMAQNKTLMLSLSKHGFCYGAGRGPCFNSTNHYSHQKTKRPLGNPAAGELRNHLTMIAMAFRPKPWTCAKASPTKIGVRETSLRLISCRVRRGS